MPFANQFAAQPRVRLISDFCQHYHWHFVGQHTEHCLMLLTIAACHLSDSLHANHLKAACLALF